MVTEVTVKLTTPEPELLALKVPLKVAAKLSLPAIGTVCVIVRVKVPEAAMTPVPLTKVWKLPKLEPVGVFRLVDPRPVNVIMRALPMPPRKVTEFVPLPAQPPHVKVPDVEKVTGSAFASDVPSATIANSNALIRVALKAIFAPLFASIVRPHFALQEGTIDRMAIAPGFRLMFPRLRSKCSRGNILIVVNTSEIVRR